MAYLTISNISKTSFDWEIGDLQYPFNRMYYDSVGITDSDFDNGTSFLPGNVLSKYKASSATLKKMQSNVSELTPGTTYMIYGFGAMKNQTTGEIEYYKIGEMQEIKTVGCFGSVRVITAPGHRSLRLILISLDIDDDCKGKAIFSIADSGTILFEEKETKYISPGDTSVSYIFRGLNPSTKYNLKCELICDTNDYKEQHYKFDEYTLSDILVPNKYYLVQTKKGETKARCIFEFDVEPDNLRYLLHNDPYSNFELEDKYILMTGIAEQYNDVIVDLLTLGEKRVYLRLIDINGTWSELGAEVTLVDGGAILEWSWDTVEPGNESTSNDRKKAYAALTNQGETEEFKYSVWNDFIEKIREAVREDFGGVVKEYEEALDNAKMTKNSRVMTASRFNNGRWVIGSELLPFGEEDEALHAHYLIAGVYDFIAYDKARGPYFLELAEKLNKAIKNINER